MMMGMKTEGVERVEEELRYKFNGGLTFGFPLLVFPLKHFEFYYFYLQNQIKTIIKSNL